MAEHASGHIAADVVLRNPDVAGESPAYDAANSRLVWVDLLVGLVRELRWSEGAQWEAGETWKVGDVASAVIPRRSGGLLVASGTKFLALSEDGAADVFASLDVGDRSDMRLSDAKCDPYGRLVAGWLTEDHSEPGGVVRLDADGSVEPLLEDVAFPNGLDWSPDGQTFYLVDTMPLRVDAFDYSVSGRPTKRRTIVTVERGVGTPDGMAVDDEGQLWVAVPYAGEVRCYSPNGVLLETIGLPARLPLSCAFGAPDGAQLFITSCSFKIPASLPESMGVARDRIEATDRDDAAGALFVCRPGVSGPAATPFGD